MGTQPILFGTGIDYLILVNRVRPLGDPEWAATTARRLGIESTMRPRGRLLCIHTWRLAASLSK